MALKFFRLKIDEHEKKSEKMVRCRDARQRRIGFGKRRFQIGRPAQNRAVTQTLRRTQPSSQSRAVSIGDVHVEFLRQSRGRQFIAAPKKYSVARQRRIAAGVSPLK